MDIHFYQYNQKQFQPAQLITLYKSADWWPERKTDDILQMINSCPVVGTWIGEQLIGFVRAVTDGFFRAYIKDVIVHPDFRGQGIGQELMKRMLGDLRHIDVISLFCEGHLVDFYQEVGFKKVTRNLFYIENNFIFTLTSTQCIIIFRKWCVKIGVRLHGFYNYRSGT